MNASLVLLVLAFMPAKGDAPTWEMQASGTTARLRGLSAVDERVVWASGSGGVVIRTLDGGKTWQHRPLPDASELDFRDLHAFDADHAVLMACGPGEKSRLYRTDDGGASWTLTFRGPDDSVFLDALSFADDRRGLALGDPVDSRFFLLRSLDGGRSWRQVEPEQMPPALAGEAAFAASGTCLTMEPDGSAWFVTGGANPSRAFSTTTEGRNWVAMDLPIAAGRASAGAFSIARVDHHRLVAVGGDFLEPLRSERNAAISDNQGRSWKRLDVSPPRGYRSCVTAVPGTNGRMLVTVGPSGSDFSTDGGESWSPLSDDGFDAVDFVAPHTGWAVGEGGRISRFRGKWPPSGR